MTNKMTQANQAAFDKGIHAFNAFTLACNGDDVFTVEMRAVVASKAGSYNRKGFEAGALAMALEHGASSPQVMRLRAKMAKVETDKAQQNWTICFAYDKKGEGRVLNAAHIQRAVSKKSTTAKKLDGKVDAPIKGVKDLHSLIAYAIDHYGIAATSQELMNQIAQAQEQSKQ